MATFLYFAFGSNLLKERLHMNNPSAVFKVIAKLQGYRFQFNSSEYCSEDGGRWHGCPANIVEDAHKYVWGSVWELNESDKRHLDNQESGYYPTEVEVADKAGCQYRCRSYILAGTYDDNSLPSPQYKDIILRGAKQSKLPTEYISFLESFPDNGNTDPIDVYKELLSILSVIPSNK